MNSSILKASIVMFIISGIIFSIAGKLRKIITADKKKGLLYLLCSFLLFGLVGLVIYKPLLSILPSSEFMVMQVIFLIIGIFHNWSFEHYFDWPDEHNFEFKILFTVAIALLGSVVFSYVLDMLGGAYYFEIYLPAVITFILPFLIWQTYLFGTNIPARKFKSWFYPRRHLQDPDHHELKNPQVISLYFKKNEDAKQLTHFRVKAPELMNFGVFFYHFINDYNTSHPESTIQYDNGGEQGWIFYHKPGLIPIRRYVDHEFTVARNNIHENQVIICRRV